MNKKIRGRYRFLMQADFKRKHFLKIQAVTYFLCFFLLCSMSIWIDNMGKIQRAEAAERYGSWHFGLIGASEGEMELIEKNRMLQASGRAAVYSGIYTEENNYLGGIGTMEESSLPLCGMKLLSGHLPENAYEIVFEQNALELLGVPYAVDGEITLTIGESEDGVHQEFTYTLCGILQSYSTYTEAGNYLPAAIVNEEGAAALVSEANAAAVNEAFAAQGQQELFIQMVEGCDAAKVQEELTAALSREFPETADGEDSKWIRNTFVYGEDFRRGDTEGVRRLISLIGYGAVFALVFTCIYRERNRTGILRTLGMLEREILVLFVGEQLLIWAVAMFCGLTLGGGSARLLLECYIRNRNLRVVVSYPGSYIRTVCLISSLALLAGGLAGTLFTKLKGAYRRGRDMNYRLLDKGGLAPLSGDMKKALLKREFKVRKSTYISLFCMQVLMLSAVAFCVTWMYRHYQEYRFNKSSYVCDYIIQSSVDNSIVWSTGKPIDKAFLNRVQNMEGVEKTETFYWNSGVEILNEEVRNGAYYRAAEDFRSNARAAFTSSLITLEAGEDLMKELAAQVDVGEWNWEKLEAGEEVIIYLPLQGLIDNRMSRLSYYEYLQDQEQLDARYAFWQEKEIKVGDVLLIRIDGAEREVKIGGIVYDLVDLGNRNRQFVSETYDIYCGPGLFWEIVGEKADSSTYIYMKSGNRTELMAEQMENLLNRSHVSWLNIRDKVRPLLEYHKSRMFLGGVMLIGFGIFFGFVLISFLNKEMEIAAYKNRLLLDLGADFDKKEKLYLNRYRWSMGLGTLTALCLDGWIVLMVTKVLGESSSFYTVWRGTRGNYPLLLVIQSFLFLAELRILLQILKKKEKISKNIYYFAP